MKNLKEVTCKINVVEDGIAFTKTNLVILNDGNEIGFYEIYNDDETEEICYFKKDEKIENVEKILPLFKKEDYKKITAYIDEDLEKKGFFIKEKEIYKDEILLVYEK